MRHATTVDEIYERFTQPFGECRLWTRAISHKNGAKPQKYGTVWHAGRCWQAHRLMYTHFVGEIPNGKHLHHVCCNARCVRPDHLHPVTPKEHVAVEPRHRTHATHCPSGHLYDEANTIRREVTRKGRQYLTRFCRACHKVETRERHRRIAAAKAPRPPRMTCRRGHAMTADNVRIEKQGARTAVRCLVCQRMTVAARQTNHQAATAP